MFTYNQLMIFINVSRFESVSQAANFMHISQPAVSSTIKKMEEMLGLTLFSYSSKKMQLTDDGQEIYKLSMNIISAYQPLLSYASNTDSTENRSQSFSCYIANCFNDTLLSQLALNTFYPKLSFFPSVKNSGSEIIEACSKASYSFGLFHYPSCDWPKVTLPQNITAEIIYTSPYTARFSQSNKLFFGRKSIKLEELSEMTFLKYLYVVSPSIYDYLYINGTTSKSFAHTLDISSVSNLYEQLNHIPNSFSIGVSAIDTFTSSINNERYYSYPIEDVPSANLIYIYNNGCEKHSFYLRFSQHLKKIFSK